MLCTRNTKTCINPLHEQALRMIYNVRSSTFETHRVIDNLFLIHHRNIFLLAIELCNARNNLSLQIMFQLFDRRNIFYSILSQTDFCFRLIYTTSYGLKSFRYLTLKLWSIVPQDTRCANSLSRFSIHQ